MKKIFLWIGMSYSFMSTAQFANPVPSTSGDFMSHSASKFSIGTGLTPTAVLDVKGDVKMNLFGTQTFQLNSSLQATGTPPILYFKNTLALDNDKLTLTRLLPDNSTLFKHTFDASGIKFESPGANLSLKSTSSAPSFLNMNTLSNAFSVSLGFPTNATILQSNTALLRLLNTHASGTLAFSTNNTDRLTIKSTGDLETVSEYQKLLFGAVSPSQSQAGYITGDDFSNKKLMLYHPMAVRLSNSPVTNPGTNISDGLYVSNGNSIGMNTFPETRLHVNLRNNAARFDVGAYPTTENADRILIGANNKMAITFLPYHGSGTAWMHLHHTLNNELMISNGGTAGDNPMVTFNANGQVFMGRKKPVNNAFGDANARLIVEGKIIANEIVANNNAGEWSSFPDYVFEKDYKLMPLDSLRGYITANKHLPEIPSAKEVEANGLHLSSLAVQQMKKIEELTLYLLEQQKQIAELQKEVAGLKSKE